MAGIEKTCEFSGNYTGWDMYGFKRNHIQVEPQYRKFFRGKKAVLTFKIRGEALRFKYGSGKNEIGYQCSYNWKMEQKYYSEKYHNVPTERKEFEKWLKENFNKVPVTEFEYTLKILDNEWFCWTGRTNFVGFTYDNPKKVIRRMKRLVGPTNLAVIKDY